MQEEPTLKSLFEHVEVSLVVTGSDRVCPILKFETNANHRRQLAETHLNVLLYGTTLRIANDQYEIHVNADIG